MKTNIDGLLRVIFENNLESIVKTHMLQDGYSSEQIDAELLRQRLEFDLRAKKNERYYGVNWEDHELAMEQVAGINEYHAMIECNTEIEAQENWEAEQAYYAGGSEGEGGY